LAPLLQYATVEVIVMDRPIGRRERSKKLLRRYSPSLLIAAAAVFLIIVAFGWIVPSVSRTDVRTAVVERGFIEATITASGTVVPLYEHVVTSPVDTRVKRILKTPGDSLSAGEPVVELDASEARLALEKLDDRIALKKVEREQMKLDLAEELNELRNQSEIKKLDVDYLAYEAQRCRDFMDEGLFTLDDLRKAEKDVERARIELRQLDESIEHTGKTLQTRLKRLDLELSILGKERDEAAHRLDLATGSTDRAGVLTWVVSSEGAAVRRGDEIARIADLSSFRVEATVPDVHGQRLSAGLPVEVRSGDTRIRGTVSNVRPMVENGVITLEIALDNRRHPVLRHNLRVEVFVITASEKNTLRLRRGQFLSVNGENMVFVVRGEKVVRVPVEFGLKNYEYYQIVGGLNEGDEVIISDMSDHENRTEVRIK
jgi:HlyD family secretion protein